MIKTSIHVTICLLKKPGILGFLKHFSGPEYTSLADTDKFTYTGIMECLEDNAAEQQFIRERMAKIFPSVSTFTDFIKQLQSESVKARIKKQTGQLLYKAADLDGT